MKKRKGFLGEILKLLLAPFIIFIAVSIFFLLLGIFLKVRVNVTIKDEFNYDNVQASLMTFLYTTPENPPADFGFEGKSVYEMIGMCLSDENCGVLENTFSEQLDMIVETGCYRLIYTDHLARTIAKSTDCDLFLSATAFIARPYSEILFGELMLEMGESGGEEGTCEDACIGFCAGGGIGNYDNSYCTGYPGTRYSCPYTGHIDIGGSGELGEGTCESDESCCCECKDMSFI